jgi:hypothetical protein
MNVSTKTASGALLGALLAATTVATIHANGGDALAQQSHGVTMNQIVAAWRARQDRVKSARFEMQQQYTTGKGTEPGKWMMVPQYQGSNADPNRVLPPEDVTHDLRRVVIFAGDKMRHERTGAQWWAATEDFVPMQYVGIFDGSDSIAYYGTPSNTNDVRSLGFLHPDKAYHPDRGSVHVLPILMHYRALTPRLSSFDAAKWIVQEQSQIVEGRECIVLKRVNGVRTYRYWVDAQRNFALMRYSKEFHTFTILQLDIAYATDPESGSVPQRWQFVKRDTDGRLIASGHSTVTNYALNCDVPEGTFEFEFPAGTEVTESGKRDPYIVMPKGRKRAITAAERDRAATYEELLATPSGQARLVQPRRGTWVWNLLWAVPVIGISAAVAFFIYRHRWR